MGAIAKILTAVAGLMGAAGVGAGAAAAHIAGDQNLQTASLYLLIHASAVAAIALQCKEGGAAKKAVLFAGAMLALGSVLFSGDLALRVLAGVKLFPMAAPAGGMILIAGWLMLTAASLTMAFRRTP